MLPLRLRVRPAVACSPSSFMLYRDRNLREKINPLHLCCVAQGGAIPRSEASSAYLHRCCVRLSEGCQRVFPSSVLLLWIAERHCQRSLLAGLYFPGLHCAFGCLAGRAADLLLRTDSLKWHGTRVASTLLIGTHVPREAGISVYGACCRIRQTATRCCQRVMFRLRCRLLSQCAQCRKTGRRVPAGRIA